MKTTTRPPHILPPRAMLERAEWEVDQAVRLTDYAGRALAKGNARVALALLLDASVSVSACASHAAWALEDEARARLMIRMVRGDLKALADLLDDARAAVDQAEGDDT